MMAFIQGGFAVIVFTMAAVLALNMEVGTETVVEAYYTQKPLEYERTFLREGTAKRWQWRFPPRVTVPQNPIRAWKCRFCRGRLHGEHFLRQRK